MTRVIPTNSDFQELLSLAAPNQFFNIRVVHEHGHTTKSWHKELDTVTQPDDSHVFWQPAGFQAPMRKHKKGDMSTIGVLWVDIDEVDMYDNYFAYPDERPEANYIIRTSEGKAHLFYVIDPVTIQTSQDILLLEGVQTALSKQLGGDKGSRDLGHISRVPGSINPKNGHVVTIEQLHNEVFSLADLNPAAAPEGTRHTAVKEAVAKAAVAGADIEAAAQAMNAAGVAEPLPQEEVDALVEWGETSDVRKLAPAPVDGVAVERWGGDSKPKLADYARALESLNIRYNAIGGRLTLNGTNITDGLFSVIFRAMDWAKYTREPLVQHALKAVAEDNDDFNPVIDWIEKTTWDNKDHIAYLAEHFEDEAGDFEIFLRHWLVGSIAKMQEPLGAFNRMLVLEGPQGVGKSYFVDWLVPPALEGYYSQDLLDTSDKDSHIKATETWVWEIGELEGITNVKDQAQLKAFLSQKKVSVRRPYGRFAMDEVVRASYIGTLNDIGGFLRDTTGNRRYMAVSLQSIDWGYVTKVDLRQLWAQALALYKSGFQWELSGDAEHRADEANQSYMASSPLAERIEGMFNIDPEDNSIAMSTNDVLKMLQPYQAKPLSTNEVAAAIQSLGPRRTRKQVNGKYVRLWVGVSPKEEQHV